MKKVILLVFGILLIVAASIVPIRNSYSWSNPCNNCETDHIKKVVTCFVISGYYSNSQHWVLLGTGDKTKCKSKPNHTCDSSSITGCETPSPN